MAALAKIFQCLSCKADIRLERKPDNSGWLRYNLDGSAHVDQKQTKKEEKKEETTRTVTTISTTELRLIFETLQSINDKLTALLANQQGVKVPE